MTDYNTLVKEAIKKAYEEKEDNTEIVENYKFEYFKKGKAIWCRMIDENNEVVLENRVYKVKENNPYTRWLGEYWYLSDEGKEIVKRMVAA